MIKLSRKVIFFWLLKVIVCSFKMQENTPLRPQNFNIFRGSTPPTPLGVKALWALPILCPGVKLSCPPVENLNEPPGLSTEGNLCFKIDWASLIVGSKFTVFALFYFVFEGNFPSTSPRGLMFGEAI